MRASPPEARYLALLAALALALVLVVVFASALIRLGGDALQGDLLAFTRGLHRASASLATLVVLAIAWLAWRAGRRALAAAIVAITAALSILGAATGVSPPPAAAAGNLLGGLALAALLAWLLGRLERRGGVPLAHAVIGLVALQAALGAWISIFAEALWSIALIAHATLGLALAAAAAWTAIRARSLALLALAFVVPLAGFGSALLGQPFAASAAHAVAVALLVAAAAYAHARLT
jgi:hypothetical protein